MTPGSPLTIESPVASPDMQKPKVPSRESAATAGDEPHVREIRSVFPEHARTRSTALGLAIFTLSAGSYAAAFAAIIYGSPWWIIVPAIAVAGLATNTLFVIGHDACHGTLTASSTLNKLLGRLCFLPNYHPYTAWEYTHNGIHHGFTNIRGKDIVFVPFSKQEFDALPPWRRWLERYYRSTPGMGLFYFNEIWWKHEMFPNAKHRAPGKKRRVFEWDRAIVVFWLTIQMASIWLAGHRTPGGFLLTTLWAIVVPATIFFWSMGFAIFLHHTNPRAPWFGSEHEWSYFRGQVRSGVHMGFPWPIEQYLHHIMDHTAHHADPQIPLYRLQESQEKLEAAYPREIIHEPFTRRTWLRTLRICRLYDYDNHWWTDYDGAQLTSRLLEKP